MNSIGGRVRSPAHRHRLLHPIQTTNDKIEAIAAETGYDGKMVSSRASNAGWE